jgi:hypothetical protein
VCRKGNEGTASRQSRLLICNNWGPRPLQQDTQVLNEHHHDAWVIFGRIPGLMVLFLPRTNPVGELGALTKNEHRGHITVSRRDLVVQNHTKLHAKTVEDSSIYLDILVSKLMDQMVRRILRLVG